MRITTHVELCETEMAAAKELLATVGSFSDTVQTFVRPRALPLATVLRGLPSLDRSTTDWEAVAERLCASFNDRLATLAAAAIPEPPQPRAAHLWRQGFLGLM
eukprot:RCo034450